MIQTNNISGTISAARNPLAAVVGRVPCPNVLYPSTYAGAAVSGGERCVWGLDLCEA